MSNLYVIDACSLIAYLRAEQGADKVEAIFDDALSGKTIVYLHKATLAEALYDSLRTNKVKNADQLLGDFYALPVTLTNTLSDDFVKIIAHNKITHKVSFADCFVLALATLINAKVLTADHHEFDLIEKAGELKFEWIR